MKKKLLLCIPLIALLVVVILMFAKVIPMPFGNGNKNEKNDTDDSIKILTENKKTQIYLLGDDIQFDNRLYVKKVNKLVIEEIEDGKLEYKVIIINDISNQVELSETEIEVLKQCFEKGYLIEYLGKKYANILLDSGEAIAEVEGNLSYEYYILRGQKQRNIGAWSEGDNNESEKYPNMLGDTMVMLIVDYLKSL